MKFKLAIFLFLFSAAVITSFSQTPVVDFEDWQQYESSTDGFRISTPGLLKISGALSADDSRIYGIVVKGVYLFVVTDPLSSPRIAKSVEKFIKDSGGKFPDVDQFDTPTKLKFVDRSGFTNVLCFAKDKERLYFVYTLSEDGEGPIAKRFMSSFEVFKTTKVNPEDSSKVSSTTPIADKNKPFVPSAPTGAGSGRGYGTGNGADTGKTSGIGSGDFAKQGPINRANSKITILSKPKSSYTDLARIFGISGFVNLRITFLSNGTVGEIAAIKKLPFGITESAIEAAKRIRFEPEYVNGSPITVKKVLQYSFTIY